MSTDILREPAITSGPFDPHQARSDFPILSQKVRDKQLVYLDNAATAQKPQVVIDALAHFHSTQNSNIHRGVHYLSQVATDAYEAARKKVQQFIHAGSEKEVVFVRGTTEGINLVAQTFGRQHVSEGDEIIVSAMEHHSNIVPWQMLCEEKKAKLKVIPMNDRGELILDEYQNLLNERTRLVSIAHISNALGTVNPLAEMVEIAHRHDVPVCVDGAQAIPHINVDVQALDCEFYTFSGHKAFGPTGIGVLYGKEHLLNAMPPYQGGGSMIQSVTFNGTTYADLPNKYEAGTPNIAGGIGLGTAIDYLEEIGLTDAAAYEHSLLAYATEALEEIPGLRIIGTAKNKVSVISFVLDDIHPHDVGTILDMDGIAVRAGHHCAQPVMDHFGIPATTRASIALYNTHDDIDALVHSIHRTIKVFR